MIISEKKERVDKQKNKAKVIKEVLKNPLLTEREIAKKVKVSNGTAHNIKKEIEQNGAKDDRILGICETDFNIVKLGQAEINRRLGISSELDKMRTFEIAQTIEKSEKRYMLFKGKATDEEGGAKDITTINIL